jgi:hypothetical protein
MDFDWSVGDLFGGAADSAADLPLPPEFVSYEDAMAANGGGGFWDSAGNWVANNAGTILRGVTALGGTLVGQNANSGAARTAADATTRAAEIQAQAAREGRAEMAAARDRGIGAIRSGTQAYTDTVAPMLEERPIMLPTYRGMTDAQRITREDMQRRAMNTLATSGLRGAGRAGVASIMDQDRRFVAYATARNDADRLGALRTARSSADSARSGLAQVRAQEGGSIANTEIGQGNRMADSITRQGQTTGQATQQVGTIQAGADVANAGLLQDALGTIGSVIAGATKDSNRDRYAVSGGSI